MARGAFAEDDLLAGAVGHYLGISGGSRGEILRQVSDYGLEILTASRCTFRRHPVDGALPGRWREFHICCNIQRVAFRADTLERLFAGTIWQPLRCRSQREEQ